MNPRELSDLEFVRLCGEIAGRLHGLTVAQADHVLRSVSKIIATTSVFDGASEAVEAVVRRSFLSAASRGEEPTQ